MDVLLPRLRGRDHFARYFIGLIVGLLALAGSASAMSVSPSSLQLTVGSHGSIAVSHADRKVSVSSSNTAVATVSYSSGTATVTARSAGSATVTIRSGESEARVAVTVTSSSSDSGSHDSNSGLSVSPTSVTVAPGSTATVSVSNASGSVSAKSSNTSVATVSYASGAATIRGVAGGSATITISDRRTSKKVAVTVTSTTASLTVSPTSLSVAAGSTGAITVSNGSGTVTATSSNTSVATVSYASGVATVRGVAAGSATITIADSKTSKTVAVTVSSTTATGNYALLAWNNLGMHCMDGTDFSIFSILPPFNGLNAQLVDKNANKAVTSGVTLTYQAVADTQGSINTISSTKTNFWQYVTTIFPGFSPAPDVGLAGYPMASIAPAAMSYNATNNWFEAVGVPITPFDDTGNTNYYPMVQVTATNSSGQVLATTKTVLPVSDEMSCAACHSSTNSTNTAANAAKPKAGWVFDSNSVTDWKKNILRLHDEQQSGNAAYTAALTAKGLTGGLYASALAGKPALCATCHASNAFLVDAGLQTGVSGIPPLTQAIHKRHAGVTDPATGMALDNTSNRGSCYNCHPGSTTQCLRGAMSNAKDAAGSITIQCQSCHGKMSAVAQTTRSGWLDEPNCQACHHDGAREASAVDASGKLLTWTDTRFATMANKPSTGYSLYRFSTGHGGMQCEACHGPTHAEYPSAQPNDNVQSIALQGHAGTIHECTACHTTVPNTTTGGPHGMHTIGSAWISSHKSAAKSNRTACAACHGADYRGSPLSQVKMAKSFQAESKTVSYTAGQAVTCYDCHNGPSGG